MQSRPKKILSILLTTLFLLSCIAPMTGVLAANKAEKDIPIIWVRGYGEKVYSQDGELVFPVEEPDGYIMDAVKDCLPSFFSAVTLGNVGPYKEKFLKWILPLYEKVKLDANGENSTGTYIDWDGIIHDSGDVENEIDVITIKNNIISFISCKNHGIDKPELYEIDAVASQFGDKYIKKEIVTTSEPPVVCAERAQQMGIKITVLKEEDE